MKAHLEAEQLEERSLPSSVHAHVPAILRQPPIIVSWTPAQFVLPWGIQSVDDVSRFVVDVCDRKGVVFSETFEGHAAGHLTLNARLLLEHAGVYGVTVTAIDDGDCIQTALAFPSFRFGGKA